MEFCTVIQPSLQVLGQMGYRVLYRQLAGIGAVLKVLRLLQTGKRKNTSCVSLSNRDTVSEMAGMEMSETAV